MVRGHRRVACVCGRPCRVEAWTMLPSTFHCRMGRAVGCRRARGFPSGIVSTNVCNCCWPHERRGERGAAGRQSRTELGFELGAAWRSQSLCPPVRPRGRGPWPGVCAEGARRSGRRFANAGRARLPPCPSHSPASAAWRSGPAPRSTPRDFTVPLGNAEDLGRPSLAVRFVIETARPTSATVLRPSTTTAHYGRGVHLDQPVDVVARL